MLQVVSMLDGIVVVTETTPNLLAQFKVKKNNSLYPLLCPESTTWQYLPWTAFIFGVKCSQVIFSDVETLLRTLLSNSQTTALIYLHAYSDKIPNQHRFVFY